MTRPLQVTEFSQRLVTAALHLEEDACTFGMDNTLENFHALLLSMREAHEALTASFREIALS